MDAVYTNRLKPRKQPIQTRSLVTVHAIFEATIQVLVQQGYSRLTTTRVAERAGVSIGTLYQYFPNKQALLAAVLEHHLEQVAQAIIQACNVQHAGTVREMITAAFNAYIDAEIERLAAMQVLIVLPLAEIGGDHLIRKASQRVQTALINMLMTASDMKFDSLEIASLILATAPIGTMQSVMRQRAGLEVLDGLRSHFIELGVSYLNR